MTVPSATDPVSSVEHRAAERFDTALEVAVEGLSARARNISATGVYFETEIDLPLGTLLNLNVQFVQNGRTHWLSCEGKVVRVTDAEDGQKGIGALLLTPFFAPAEEAHADQPAPR